MKNGLYFPTTKKRTIYFFEGLEREIGLFLSVPCNAMHRGMVYSHKAKVILFERIYIHNNL
jgi:hypothetical protein